MVDTEEILRLPKPIQMSSCDMRPELVNFSGERRWDLLGFVRPDEIEEIKGCNIDENGNRYYLVHWKESWKPESSLIYCEKLLQQFWAQKSLIQQEEQATLAIANEPNIKINAEEPGGSKERLSANVVFPTETISSIELPSSHHLITDSQPQDFQTGTVDDSSESVDSAFAEYKSSTDADVDMIVICQGIVEEPQSTSVEKNKNELNQLQQVGQNKEANPRKQQGNLPSIEEEEEREGDGEGGEEEADDDEEEEQKNERQEQEEEFKNLNNAMIMKDQEAAGKEPSKEETVENIDLIQESVLSVDFLSKKGASKRKNRLPRQSVQSTSVVKAKKDKKGKDKTKKILNSKGKINKMVSTIITADKSKKSLKPKQKNTTETDSSVGANERSVSVNTSTSGNLKCMVCDKSLSSQQNLMKHLLTHNNNHTCTICMKTFKSTHFLKHHMDKHNPSYEYACPECDKKFKFKNNMRSHFRKHNMEKKFECEVCNKKFIGRYNLKEHMKSHSDVRPFECDFCRKKYKDRGALNKHLLSHQEKKVECEICKRPFTNTAQLKRHMQFHFSWPGDTFKRKSTVVTEGDKQKYTCEYCNKIFNHYSNMNAHIHKKHKEKKIECPKCAKMFAYQYELREHMFIHSGGQEASKFKCKFCEKSFQRSTTLKNHERTTHLGIKRFKCNICGKMFGTKFNMKVHVEKLHPNGEIGVHTTTITANRRGALSSARNNDKIRTNELGLPNPGVDDTVNYINTEASMAHVTLPNQQHPLLRNMTTSDIIRSAMSNMPELGYFPGLQSHPAARAYQFYGIPPPDFGVPN